jgi:hypothetical protein
MKGSLLGKLILSFFMSPHPYVISKGKKLNNFIDIIAT